MHCTLLIPGLLWPRESAELALRGLELPALQQLLARAHAQSAPPATPEAWLCAAYNVKRQQDWPIAPLTLALDGGECADAYWLRADPVHLELGRNQLTLIESARFTLTQEEAQSLADALDQHFTADGMRFCAPAAKRWYVSVPQAPELITRAVSESAGRDVHACLPTGQDALIWHRIFNEVQMLLHGHPVNAAREERGEPAVNSVWFWGGGQRIQISTRPFDAVWSDDATAIALASASGAHMAEAPSDANVWQQAVRVLGDDRHLVQLDQLASPFAHRNVESWRASMRTIDQSWLAPLIQSLRAGLFSSIAVVAPRAGTSWRFELSRSDARRFWRRSRSPRAYA